MQFSKDNLQRDLDSKESEVDALHIKKMKAIDEVKRANQEELFKQREEFQAEIDYFQDKIHNMNQEIEARVNDKAKENLETET